MCVSDTQQRVLLALNTRLRYKSARKRCPSAQGTFDMAGLEPREHLQTFQRKTKQQQRHFDRMEAFSYLFIFHLKPVNQKPPLTAAVWRTGYF